MILIKHFYIYLHRLYDRYYFNKNSLYVLILLNFLIIILFHFYVVIPLSIIFYKVYSYIINIINNNKILSLLEKDRPITYSGEYVEGLDIYLKQVNDYSNIFTRFISDGGRLLVVTNGSPILKYYVKKNIAGKYIVKHNVIVLFRDFDSSKDFSHLVYTLNHELGHFMDFKHPSEMRTREFTKIYNEYIYERICLCMKSKRLFNYKYLCNLSIEKFMNIVEKPVSIYVVCLLTHPHFITQSEFLAESFALYIMNIKFHKDGYCDYVRCYFNNLSLEKNVV